MFKKSFKYAILQAIEPMWVRLTANITSDISNEKVDIVVTLLTKCRNYMIISKYCPILFVSAPDTIDTNW